MARRQHGSTGRELRVSGWTFLAAAAFALVLWVNAALHFYRFNVAEALVGSLPLVLMLLTTRRTSRAVADDTA